MESGDGTKFNFLSLHYSKHLISTLLHLKIEKGYCNKKYTYSKISESPVETLHAFSEWMLPYLPNLRGWKPPISTWKKTGNVFVNKLFGNWASHLYKQQWRERDRACRGNHLLPGIRWRGRWSGRREHDHFFGAGPRTFLMPHLFLKQKKKKKS